MTIIGTPPTLTAEQADDLLHAAMRAGRVPFAPVDEHEQVPGDHPYTLADGAAVLVRHDGAVVVLDLDTCPGSWARDGAYWNGCPK
jgi:hypothetical protein